ncbi:hypothetical protein EIN_384480 [Entamoeba invadens IP1]|uniref:Leucine rich repeat containing protein BspA family protein n=1 Tax=Entamoeba invadens IP1 TaxID=370355 RepID=L7FLN0_ENTIV|nr:hypothetical protein EIN_384480 [Entamoeba invadens IP1]ELP84059.1 hypothetical protein EIN_384480 [Entamoeba invadens IP1]|eukprot:XP_004183405.1 hypothetical protein EIN_384480 [Entamoeba invadens IP1]
MCRLFGYHIMIVSKYFEDIIDFINLELVCKKFQGNMGKFHFNPISLNYKTFGYFPNIETLHLWSKEDETFGNGFMINTKENRENKGVLKKEFYRIIVWFNVDFETVENNKSQNIEFKNVTYTQNDRKKFGNNIPSSVTSIGDGVLVDALILAVSLNNVTIPSSVTSIGDGCFRQCNSLNNVTLSLSVISIGDGYFYECNSLHNVFIPSSVTLIGDQCFFKCVSLTGITIPSSMKSIGDCCFKECINLTNVTIPSGVTSIGIQCFPLNIIVHRD